MHEDDLIKVDVYLPQNSFNWLYTLKNLTNLDVNNIINILIVNSDDRQIKKYLENYKKISKIKREDF